MKKISILPFVVVLFLSVSKLSAQSHYHHVGDTIVGRSPIYFYNWWSDIRLADTSKRLRVFKGIDPFPLLHGESLQYFYTETPIQVIGIATTLIPARFQVSILEMDTVTCMPEYLRLYDAFEDNFQLVEEVMYSHRDVSPRYISLTERSLVQGWMNENNVRDKCCYYATPETTKTFAIREFYFEKPVTVYDSFYVGYTQESVFPIGGFPPSMHEFVTQNHDFVRLTGVTYFWDNRWGNDRFNNSCEKCDTTSFLKKYRTIFWELDPFSPNYGDTIQELSQWRWRRDPYFEINLPIIVIDSSYIIPPYECPSVQNFRLSSVSPNNVVLLWDTHSDHDSWQISYGPAGINPDSGTIRNCSVQVAQINNYDSCTDYDVYIRAICHHDSTEYSQWNGPVSFNICDTTHYNPGDNEGISYGLDQFVKLFPNPATNHVQVVSSFKILHIEIYDTQGRQILNREVDGHSSLIDLGKLQQGDYFAIIHTSFGNYTKKLVVKR